MQYGALAAGFGGALVGVRPFQATVQEPGFYALQIEQGTDVGQRLLVVKGLAGENVNVHVVPPGEGVNADVAFGDDDETGNAAVIGVGAVVFQHFRLGYPGHAKIGRVLVQKRPQPGSVPHHAGIAAESVNNQVHPASRLPQKIGPAGRGRAVL